MSLAPKLYMSKPGRYLVSTMIVLLFLSHLIVGAQNINKVEYFFDNDPGLGLGTDVPVSPDTNLSNFNFNIGINALSQGFHHLNVRAKDDNGKWSLTHNQTFYKVATNSITPNIIAVEYFFDTDPGYGNGHPISIIPGTLINNINYTIGIGSLSNGFHAITVRAKDANGVWSTAHSASFFKETFVPQTPDIVALEYYIDTDPGYGNATSIPFTAGQNVEVIDYYISLLAINNGFHKFAIRAKDSFGKWSHCFSSGFYKENYVPSLPDIVKVEYFLDIDPGVGNGIVIPATTGSNVEALDFIISLDSVSNGFHQLFARAEDANGKWSHTTARAFFKEIYNPTLPNLVNMEYFIDTDPGFGNGSNIPISQGPQLNNVIYNIPIFALSNGFHALFVRTKDANGRWSLTHMHPFFKEAYVPVLPDIVKLEYYFDTDPGFGSGVNIPISGDTTFTEQSITIDMTGIANGFHKIFFRAKDSKGKWSLTNFRAFYKEITYDTLPNVVKVEYFYDTDPGFGNGINVPVTPSQNITFLAFALDLTNVAFGQHQLNVRVKDKNGLWSLVTQDTIFYYLSSLPTASLAGPQGVCVYSPAEFTVTLTGSGPWTIIYNSGEETDTISNIQTSFYTLNITPQTTGTHTAQILKVSDSQYTGLYTGIPIEFEVHPFPAAADPVTGTANVCRGTTGVTYYVPNIANTVDYVWTVPSGCTYTQYNNYWYYYGSVIYVNFPVGAQSGDIMVHGINGCGIASSSTFHVDVRETPSVNAGNDIVIDYGGDTTLNAIATGGNPPYTFSWSPWYYCNNAGISNPVVTPPSTAGFTVNLTDFYGCAATDNLTVYVGGPPGSNITGIMSYDNTFHTPMNNSTVFLKQGSTIISQTTTDGAGHYSLTGVPAGYYTITGSSSKTWGGVNATDALLILKHFAQVQLLNGLKITGSNVNGDGTVNSIDALLTAKRFIGTVTSFAIGDWVSESPYFYADVSGDITQDFKALCTADADGSYIPAAKQEAAVILVYNSSLPIKDGDIVDLPVKAAFDCKLGAMSLVLSVPDWIEVLDVKPGKSSMGELLYSIEGEQLRIGWYSLKSADFISGETLLTLKIKTEKNQNSDWLTGSESVFADGNGINLSQSIITMPHLINIESGGLNSWNLPNPFNDQTRISYTLPYSGKVLVKIYNSLGQEVLVPVNTEQNAGTYSILVEGNSLPVGAYVYKLILETNTETLTTANRMIVTR